MRGIKHRATEIPGYKDGIPIVLCEKSGTDQFRFYCQYCRRYHYHGAAEGHRVAHCINDTSPFQSTGYYLAYFKTTHD